MKHIKIASVLLAIIFVAASSFTHLTLTHIYQFDRSKNGGNPPDATTVQDYTKYVAVSNACSATLGDVCSIDLVTVSQTVGTTLGTDFTSTQKAALSSAETNQTQDLTNKIKMIP